MKLTPAAATSTRTSPGLGGVSGRSTTVRTSGPPASVAWTARMNHVYPARLGGRYGARVRGYVRPEVAERVFRDASGAVVDYGNRWDGGSPPEDAYPVPSHSERVAPLWAVAESLVEPPATTHAVADGQLPSVPQ